MADDKGDLELAKLRLEIARLGLPWYKNLEFWKIIIPTLAVLASLYFTFGRGIVDAQKEQLGIQKEQLKLEILQFEVRKTDIQGQVTDIELLLRDKELELFKLNDTLSILSNSLTSYEDKINTYKSQIETYKSRLADKGKEHQKDRKYYQDKLVERYQIENQKVAKERELLKRIEELQVSLKAMEAGKAFLEKRVKLTELEEYELKRAQLEAKADFYSKSLRSAEEIEQSFEASMAKDKARLDTMSLEETIREFELQMIKHEAREKKK